MYHLHIPFISTSPLAFENYRESEPIMPVWDTHAHVIDHRYPFADGRDYTPDPASLEDYLAMLDRNGIERGVLVQPSFYGFDNRCLLDALDRADGRLVGVIVPDPETPSRELVT